MPRILRADDPHAQQLAAETLRRGALVVLPTDTVYGVAAWPWEPAAVQRLYWAKARPEDKAIPLLVGEVGQLVQVTSHMPEGARRLARRFWPGPLTLIVPKHPDLPPMVSPYPTVGVRMPNHAAALAVLRLTGPLAVTSANRSGQPPARTAAEAAAQLGDAVALILDAGPAPQGQASTVVDCTTSPPRLLRAGPVALEDILAAWAG